MHDIFDLAKSLKFAEGDSYLLSYPHLLTYFSSKQEFSKSDFVCGAHMVYGWMPTILELYPESPSINLEQAASLLTIAKKTGLLSDDQINQLASITNNSLVGASKLLHFTAPQSFAIWDSRVYTFLHLKKPHHYQIRDVKLYREYHNKLNMYKCDQGLEAFCDVVNKAVGYNVSALRALELVMFQNSLVTGG